MHTLCLKILHRSVVVTAVAPVREWCYTVKSPLRCAQHPWLRSQGIAADKPLDSVVLQRMRKLSATNKLKKAALVVMAKSLSAVRCHQVLCSCFRSSACPESCQTLCDFLSNGKVGHSAVQMLRLSVEWHVHKQDEINGLQQLFRNIDADNSGTITIDELRTALTSCNGKMSVRATASPSVVTSILLCKSEPVLNDYRNESSAAATMVCS